MVRIPGTTFSDYTPKTDWEKKYHDLVKHVEQIDTKKGGISELEDLIEDIYCRFPLEDAIAATKKHIEFRLRNIHLKSKFRKELEKYLAVLAAGERDDI